MDPEPLHIEPPVFDYLSNEPVKLPRPDDRYTAPRAAATLTDLVFLLLGMVLASLFWVWLLVLHSPGP